MLDCVENSSDAGSDGGTEKKQPTYNLYRDCEFLELNKKIDVLKITPCR